MLAISGINFGQKTNFGPSLNNQKSSAIKMHSQPLQDCVSFRGLPHNFGEVATKKGDSVAKFFRSALPDDAQALKDKGVKYVMDLRTKTERDSEPEEQALKELGIEYITPDLPDMIENFRVYLVAVKKLVKDIDKLLERNDGALIVHCEHGERRTSQVVAAYQHYIDNLPEEEIVKHAQRHKADIDMISLLCTSMKRLKID